MKLMRRVALLATLVVGVCSAGVIAVAPNGGSAGSDGRPFMIGWQFSVSTALQLDGLAY